VWIYVSPADVLVVSFCGMSEIPHITENLHVVVRQAYREAVIYISRLCVGSVEVMCKYEMMICCGDAWLFSGVLTSLKCCIDLPVFVLYTAVHKNVALLLAVTATFLPIRIRFAQF